MPASNVPRLWRVFGVALALLVSGAAQAGPAVTPLRWLCWLEASSTTLACAQEGALFDALFDDPVLQARTDHAQPPDQRAILRAGSVTAALRTQAEAAQPTVWRTPLFSPAYDDDFTALLARSVMCGRQPDCRVQFRPAAPLDFLEPDTDALRLAASTTAPR